jgi:hypothetical protein
MPDLVPLGRVPADGSCGQCPERNRRDAGAYQEKAVVAK